MNREQAAHILDAYVRILMDEANEASDALREVILDAMTGFMPGNTWQGVTLMPGNTWPSKPNYERPIVTCRTEVGE